MNVPRIVGHQVVLVELLPIETGANFSKCCFGCIKSYWINIHTTCSITPHGCTLYTHAP